MSILKKVGALLAAAAVSLSVTATMMIGGATPAAAAPEWAYPKPVMKYRSHPDGFPDSSEVRVRGSSISCNTPLAAAYTQGGTKVNVRKELQPLIQELMRRTEASGYKLRSDTWGYNCRFIAGTRTPSNHAYGRAVDLNSATNPWSYNFRSDIPPAVVNMWINHGFYWGGHYKKHDTMHFEYVGSFANIGYYYRKLTGQPQPTPPPPAPTTCGSSTLARYPALKSGARGTAVKVLQCELRQSGQSISADGIFGPVTLAAVKSFQRSKGLAADGIVGPKTWTALLAAGTKPTLSKGARGTNVTRLQQSLRARGYSIAIDGIFGNGTRSVVISYQRARGLAADGIVGSRTWTALQAGR